MGQTYRKHNGKWITVEQYERVAKQAADEAETDTGDDEPDVLDEARAVLERADHKEMGSFLAEHRDEPTPKGTDDRKSALEAFIGEHTE